MAHHEYLRFSANQIDNFLTALTSRGYTTYGPVVRDGAVVYDTIDGVADLPKGCTDTQAPAHYRLEQASNGQFFAYTLGAQSWKSFLHPAQIKLFEAQQHDGVFHILNNHTAPTSPRAFLGVRACELAAIQIQDRVLQQGQFQDPIYHSNRDGAFLIAMQCTRSAATCFCASMNSGPGVRNSQADLVLTEMSSNDEHWFLAQAGTERGAELLTALETQPATEADRNAVNAAVHAAATQQTRAIDTTGIHNLLFRNFEHARWDQVAERCLACANCTMVCPTCFCTSVEDTSDVTGAHAERWRRWDSCFTTSFSYIHGGSVRTSGKARYRQWMTHKLAAWIDQFGTSGCVGCGRCITWCPAGIDITEEMQAIRGEAKHGNTNA